MSGMHGQCEKCGKWQATDEYEYHSDSGAYLCPDCWPTTTSKHTPGPWDCVERDNDKIIPTITILGPKSRVATKAERSSDVID